MISSKADLKYLECYPLTFKIWLGSILCPSIWKFQVNLGKMEYFNNCKKNNLIQKIVFF